MAAYETAIVRIPEGDAYQSEVRSTEEPSNGRAGVLFPWLGSQGASAASSASAT
jgi:hypothetical protein